MERMAIIGMSFLFCGWLCAQGGPSPILKDLLEHGGIATFELTVKDDQGKPVEGAEANAGFWNPVRVSNLTTGETDSKGYVKLSERSWMDGGVTIKKDGYYESYVNETFAAPDKAPGWFERRRWRPVVREVTLQKKRNPIPMYAYFMVSLPFPKGQRRAGFDLKKCDWMPPFGAGEQLDMLVSITTREKRNGKDEWREAETLTFHFPNPGDGIQLHEKVSSLFPTTHHVNSQQSFLQTMIFSTVNARYMVDEKHYLTFRTRTEYNTDGTIKRVYYGKIHGIVEMIDDSYLELQAVYFNPTPNDTNLEFDPDRNLVSREELRRKKRWP